MMGFFVYLHTYMFHTCILCSHLLPFPVPSSFCHLCDDRKILQLLLKLPKDEQSSTLNHPSISLQGERGRLRAADFTICQVKYSLVQSNSLIVLLHIKCSITSVYMKVHDLHQNHYMPIFKEFGRKSKCQLV